MADVKLTDEQLYEISLNSVSMSQGNIEDGFNHDFTGNDIAFAHTTEEVNRKAHSTVKVEGRSLDELSDEELLKIAEEAEKAEAEAAAGQDPQE